MGVIMKKSFSILILVIFLIQITDAADTTNSIEWVKSIATQSTGNIISGGFSTIKNVNGSFLIVRTKPNGALDKSFGSDGDGKVFTTFAAGNTNLITVIKVQQSNNYIVAGGWTSGLDNNSSFAIARYTANGILDTTFNGTGLVTTSFGPNSSSSLESLIILPDGGIVVGGYTNAFNPKNDFIVAKYTNSGALDTSFNGTGYVIPQFTTIYGDGAASDFILSNSIAIDKTGGIIAGGISSAINNNFNFSLIRIMPDGTLDTTFGSSKINKGLVLTNFENILNVKANGINSINSLLIQPNGKIVAGGFTNIEDPNLDFAIARYHADGTLDKTTHNLGLNFIDFSHTLNMPVSNLPYLGSRDIINSIALQDTKIIAGGTTNLLNTTNSFALARFLNTLELDSSFGTKGVVVTNFAIESANKQAPGSTLTFSTDIINSIAIQKNNYIIAAGSTTLKHAGGNFALARYTPEGKLDKSFATLGFKAISVSTVLGISKESSDVINRIVLQPDGKIIAVGSSTATNPLGNFVVARFNTNGSLDNSFGTKGIVLTNFSSGTNSSQNIGQSLLLLSDGSIIAGGLSTALSTFNAQNPNYNFALAKYTNKGIPDITFGQKGLVLTAFSTVLGTSSLSNDQLNSLALTPDNLIVAGGTSNVNDPNFDFALAAYNTYGILNSNFGNNGIILTDFKTVLGLGFGSTDVITPNSSIAIQKNGNIIAGGHSNATNPNDDFALAKYNTTTPVCTQPADLFIQFLRKKYFTTGVKSLIVKSNIKRGKSKKKQNFKKLAITQAAAGFPNNRTFGQVIYPQTTTGGFPRRFHKL
jgi:uncharacterized delta-60 repeat protein